MANVTTLHWNLETYGPAKWANGNNAQFINYIAQVVVNVNADIVAFVEVKNSIAANVAAQVVGQVDNLQGVVGATPWRILQHDSGDNNEAYIIMYRTDRNFLPIRLAWPANQVGAGVLPENGAGMEDVANNRISFPSRWTAQGGRRPFYAAFQTTDTANIFTVISYHAMFGPATALGIQRLPSLNIVTQFDDGPPATAIQGCLISGDFNVDFVPAIPGFYANVLNLPSTQATDNLTSLSNNPAGGNDPATFLANAYDNIFQKIPAGGAANPGVVINLMVESSVVVAPQPPPPAAQPNVGNLSAVAGAFNVANLLNHGVLNPVAAVPPDSMNTAWDFVRGSISNHYPVSVTTTI